jgi:hypothetical protein
MPAPAYGNAPAGEYKAIFTGTFPARYPKGQRLIFGFLLLDQNGRVPLFANDGTTELRAVAVCNLSNGENPKSKPYRICKAMLRQDEFDPIEAAMRVPPPEHFLPAALGEPRRLLGVRVARRNDASLVTDIQRPRDGVWECIEGKFEGGPRRRFSWLNADGTVRRY